MRARGQVQILSSRPVVYTLPNWLPRSGKYNPCIPEFVPLLAMHVEQASLVPLIETSLRLYDNGALRICRHRLTLNLIRTCNGLRSSHLKSVVNQSCLKRNPMLCLRTGEEMCLALSYVGGSVHSMRHIQGRSGDATFPSARTAVAQQ